MKPFQFKQFSIHQDRCAMKVGTDGVLLGAWASLEGKPNSILDIGAGTGLIAMMMAQRSNAASIGIGVDAVELDANAFEQCVENFEASPWSDRLFCYHASFQDFAKEIDESYDLIVSNPPFFSEEVSSGNSSRDIARQEASLPFQELLLGVSNLLSNTGQFAIVLPLDSEKEFTNSAEDYGLYPIKITHVKGNKNAPIKRSLLEFSRRPSGCRIDTLIIEQQRHIYSEAYIKLTEEFYLKM